MMKEAIGLNAHKKIMAVIIILLTVVAAIWISGYKYYQSIFNKTDYSAELKSCIYRTSSQGFAECTKVSDTLKNGQHYINCEFTDKHEDETQINAQSDVKYPGNCEKGKIYSYTRYETSFDIPDNLKIYNSRIHTDVTFVISGADFDIESVDKTLIESQLETIKSNAAFTIECIYLVIMLFIIVPVIFILYLDYITDENTEHYYEDNFKCNFKGNGSKCMECNHTPEECIMKKSYRCEHCMNNDYAIFSECDNCINRQYNNSSAYKVYCNEKQSE